MSILREDLYGIWQFLGTAPNKLKDSRHYIYFAPGHVVSKFSPNDKEDLSNEVDTDEIGWRLTEDNTLESFPKSNPQSSVKVGRVMSVTDDWFEMSPLATDPHSDKRYRYYRVKSFNEDLRKNKELLANWNIQS